MMQTARDHISISFIHPRRRKVHVLAVRPNETIDECLERLCGTGFVEPEQDGGRYHVLDIRNGREISRLQEVKHTGLESGDKLSLAYWARRQ